MSNKETGANHPTVIKIREFMDLLKSGNYEEFKKNNKDGDFEIIKIM